MNYWLVRSGVSQGPYSPADIRIMILEGNASPSDLAWAEGMTEWAPLSEVLPPPAAQVYQAPVPDPPSMNVALLIVLNFFTSGLVGMAVFLQQVWFAKKLDKANKARLLIMLAMATAVVSGIGMFPYLSLTTLSDEQALQLAPFEILFLCVPIFMTAAVFQIRKAMLKHYNSVEPIGLKLSRPLTFFLHMYYLQYHLSRIADWKRTGVLTPQQ